MAIKKPWCIRFDAMGDVRGIGKVETEDDERAYVRYLEGQLFSLRVWHKDYLKRYESFARMVRAFAKEHDISYKKALEKALDDFPSQKK